jgi:chemotaxis methyl-accepting protein methylase
MMKEMKMDGIMAVSENEEGLRTLDFECCELVKMEEFRGKYDVLGARDGNIYMTEQKKRKRIKRKPLFREDNSTLSLGVDHKYRFRFTLEEKEADKLHQLLTVQAKKIARKFSLAFRV